MKILYIGNFTDGTGWAKAGTYNALSLDAAGYDVYCAELKYNQASVVHEPRILELMERESDSYDITIQHVLPSEYRRYPNTKNVGFIAKETVTLSNLLWTKKISMMDAMLSPREWGHTFNYDKTTTSYGDVNIPELNNTFNFLFVGEFVKRKNLEALLVAFHSEFETVEPVSLCIKTGATQQQLNDFCTNVKQRIRKQGTYKKEVIITDRLADEVLWSIMRKCHSFVMPSYGEAWCYPAMEAAANGLRLIYTEDTGIDLFATLGDLRVPANAVQCYGATDAVDGLYTSEDIWLEVNIRELRQAMRRTFKEWGGKPILPNSDYKYYDYRNIQKTKEQLDESLHRIASN